MERDELWEGEEMSSMNLDERVRQFRDSLVHRSTMIGRVLDGGPLEEWYERSLKGQRADYTYLVKELDAILAADKAGASRD